MQYNPSETNLPKWTQQLLDELRAENIRLREKASAALAAHIVKLDRDWFVMPGPSGGTPAITRDFVLLACKHPICHGCNALAIIFPRHRPATIEASDGRCNPTVARWQRSNQHGILDELALGIVRGIISDSIGQ